MQVSVHHFSTRFYDPARIRENIEPKFIAWRVGCHAFFRDTPTLERLDAGNVARQCERRQKRKSSTRRCDVVEDTQLRGKVRRRLQAAIGFRFPKRFSL
jgi:hypothetical protein